MKSPIKTSVPRRGHPLDLFPVFQCWPRSHARDLLYTALWNTLIALVISAALQSFGVRPAPFHVLFSHSLLISQCVGFAIHCALLVLGAAVPRSSSRLIARLLELTAIILASIFGITLAASILAGTLTAPYLDVGDIGGLVASGLVISVAMLAMLVAGERRIERQTSASRQQVQISNAARLMAESQLSTLRAKIEPHFLYNSLANAVSLIESQPAQARRLLEGLIDFLRASLAVSRTNIVTLGAELDLAAAYLQVLDVRMGARLHWHIDAATDLRCLSVAPMLIQPLVDNAVKHGIEPMIDGGEIVLLALIHDGFLRVEVRDSGRGLVADPLSNRRGTSLLSLRERLRQLHGPVGNLELIENPGGGVIARLTLPLTRSDTTSSLVNSPD